MITNPVLHKCNLMHTGPFITGTGGSIPIYLTGVHCGFMQEHMKWPESVRDIAGIWLYFAIVGGL